MVECISQNNCNEFEPKNGNQEEYIFEKLEAGDVMIISKTGNSFLVAINPGGELIIKHIEV